MGRTDVWPEVPLPVAPFGGICCVEGPLDPGQGLWRAVRPASRRPEVLGCPRDHQRPGFHGCCPQVLASLPSHVCSNCLVLFWDKATFPAWRMARHTEEGVAPSPGPVVTAGPQLLRRAQTPAS